MRSAWPLVCKAWVGLSKEMAMWGDRVVWNTVRESGLRVARSAKPTVNYASMIVSHYVNRGEAPPAGARIYLNLDGKTVSVSNEELEELKKRYKVVK